MRKVRTCDFCGDDATGVYEPLPPSVPEAPRMLLCDDCRDRLASVVDPVLALIDDAAGTGVEPTETGAALGTGDAPAARSSPGEVPDVGAESDPDSEPEPEPEPASPEATADGDDPVEAGGRPPAERTGPPTGYRKVMRFLENRELPIDREEAEHLAAEAYEIEPDAVAEAIDHAVRYGRLREVDGELKE